MNHLKISRSIARLRRDETAPPISIGGLTHPPMPIFIIHRWAAGPRAHQHPSMDRWFTHAHLVPIGIAGSPMVLSSRSFQIERLERTMGEPLPPVSQ